MLLLVPTSATMPGRLIAVGESSCWVSGAENIVPQTVAVLPP